MKINLYSGGLDSWLLSRLYPGDKYVFCDFGQKNQEYLNACKTCPGFLLKLHLPHLGVLNTEAFKETPYRNNLILASILAVFSAPELRWDGLEVRFGCMARENKDYYTDCSPKWFQLNNRVLATQGKSRVSAPLLSFTLSEWLAEACAKKLVFQPVTYCNVTTTGKNCGACPKCTGVEQACRNVGRPDLLETFNGD